MKAKKKELLSSLGKKVVQVVEKGTSITPITFVLEVTRMASPMNFLEELSLFVQRGRGL